MSIHLRDLKELSMYYLYLKEISTLAGNLYTFSGKIYTFGGNYTFGVNVCTSVGFEVNVYEFK